ncbi:MAG: hypothetical protein NZ937_09760, partial [Armatimonadetes bacterium]|nr:hypothetical protein [Armatimonadota bacterium]
KEVVVPVLNFGESEEVEVSVNLSAIGFSPVRGVKATVYQPLLSGEKETVKPSSLSKGKLTFKLKVPMGWKGITLLELVQ